MAADVVARMGADRDERTTPRNGHCGRDGERRVGTVPLQIPKLRQGSDFPHFLEPRRRPHEHALTAVVQKASVLRVSTRQGDARVQAMGVATRVHAQGNQEVLGSDVGPREDADCWTLSFRGPVNRGLTGVQPVVSDTHRALHQAIQTVFQGARWQRCPVHTLRHLLGTVPQSAQVLGATPVRTIMVHSDKSTALVPLIEGAETPQSRFPPAAISLRNRADNRLAFMSFPAEHERPIHSTNPWEHLNRAIGRRPNGVGIFPNRAAALWLPGAVLMEQHDEGPRHPGDTLARSRWPHARESPPPNPPSTRRRV